MLSFCHAVQSSLISLSLAAVCSVLSSLTGQYWRIVAHAVLLLLCLLACMVVALFPISVCIMLHPLSVGLTVGLSIVCLYSQPSASNDDAEGWKTHKLRCKGDI